MEVIMMYKETIESVVDHMKSINYINEYHDKLVILLTKLNEKSIIQFIDDDYKLNGTMVLENDDNSIPRLRTLTHNEIEDLQSTFISDEYKIQAC